MTVAAYGSYYPSASARRRDFHSPHCWPSAVALEAPAIRVWAGGSGSATTSKRQRAAIIADAQRIATLAAHVGVRVLSEWHGGTLTDTAASGLDFLRVVGHANFATIWQPGVGLSTEAAEAELIDVLPLVEHLHVFHWRQHERLPLREGIDAWRRYLALAATPQQGTQRGAGIRAQR